MKLICTVAPLMFLNSARAFAAKASHTFRPFIGSRLAAAASSTMTAVETNPLLEQEGLPKFSSIEPEFITPAVEDLLGKLEKDFEKMEQYLAAAGKAVQYDEVLPAVERMQFPLGYVWGVAGHLNGVKNGDELRKSYEANQPKVIQAMTKFSQSKPLYDALSAIEEQWGSETKEDDDFLTQQKRRAVENSLRGMKLGGVGLEGAEKVWRHDARDTPFLGWM